MRQHKSKQQQAMQDAADKLNAIEHPTVELFTRGGLDPIEHRENLHTLYAAYTRYLAESGDDTDLLGSIWCTYSLMADVLTECVAVRLKGNPHMALF